MSLDQGNERSDAGKVATTGGITLPIEIIITIGEFLAGSHALNSLSTLSLVNREIHQGILPVLYETLVWDTEESWWIFDKGHIPSGWKWTRYLITLEGPLRKLETYLRAISEIDSNVHEAKMTEAFPCLAVVFTKALPKIRECDMHNIFLDVTATLYKPVNMQTLLIASSTSLASETTFCGASVLSTRTRHGPRYSERISAIRMLKGARIRTLARPVLVSPNTGAFHKRTPDAQLSVHVMSEVYRLADGQLHRLERDVKETFEAFLSAIPARKRNSDLCHIEVKCMRKEFDILLGVLLPCLKEHVHISMSFGYGFDALTVLRVSMAALAEQYLAAWTRLGPNAAGKQFFRVDMIEVEEWEEATDDSDSDGHRREEYLNIATLATFPGPIRFIDADSGANRAPKGFQLVLKRIVHDSGPYWNEDEEEPLIYSKRDFFIPEIQ